MSMAFPPPPPVAVTRWVGAALFGLSTVIGSSAWAAQTGADGPALLERFRPGEDHVATVIYEAAAGRPLRLTVASGPAGDAAMTVNLNATAEDLQPLVAELRELSLLRPPASLGRIVRLGDELGNVLLAPIAEQLRNVTHLVLFADGALADLPFGALRAPRSLDPQGRYLVETRTLCWGEPALDVGAARAAPALAGARQRKAADQDRAAERRRNARHRGLPARPQAGERPVALAIADAVYRPPARPLGASMSDGGVSWRRHAARRNQANTIAALDLPMVSRFGQDASPSLFWESTENHAIRFLHLAVEARIDPDRPDRSALLLSPERYDEQAIPVTAGQLASRLALERGSLVVLSGLDAGDHGVGPGPFAEAFGAAGAGAVLASLWPVVDESATHLFAAFYRHAAEGSSPAAALRQAQLGLLEQPLRFHQGEGRESVRFDASHPYFWAGYRVYQGSAKSCG